MPGRSELPLETPSLKIIVKIIVYHLISASQRTELSACSEWRAAIYSSVALRPGSSSPGFLVFSSGHFNADDFLVVARYSLEGPKQAPSGICAVLILLCLMSMDGLTEGVYWYA